MKEAEQALEGEVEEDVGGCQSVWFVAVPVCDTLGFGSSNRVLIELHAHEAAKGVWAIQCP